VICISLVYLVFIVYLCISILVVTLYNLVSNSYCGDWVVCFDLIVILIVTNHPYT
jgi:hypothetical protein